ncbi:MAG TPA: hypothetical protein PK156_38070 [Polyangium sp.]|nr:hypothetical protein [Polyangium sp.]
METRELYKQKVEAQIHEWSAKLDVLKAKSEKLTVQAKLDMQPSIDAVHAKYDAAKAQLDKIGTASDDKWDEVVKDVDQAWNDFKAAVEGTFDAMKAHT